MGKVVALRCTLMVYKLKLAVYHTEYILHIQHLRLLCQFATTYLLSSEIFSEHGYYLVVFPQFINSRYSKLHIQFTFE